MVPDKFNMVDMGSIDLIMMQGEAVPGLYDKLMAAISNCRYQCLYNWLFDGVLIPPTYVQLEDIDGEVFLNEGVSVTSDDVIHIYSLEPGPVDPDIIPLLAEENGVYNAPAGKDGFNPVTVDVPSYTPVIEPITITENGRYNSPSGVDGYSPITVNVSSGSVNILTGTDEPASSIGSDGQIYLQYGIPPDYTLVEYLEINSSGPYIDTEVINTSEAYFEVVGNWTQTPGNNEGLFGAQTGSETTINSWNNVQFIRVGSSGANISTPTEKHKFTANNNGIFIDDVFVGTPNWNNITNRSYYLFAVNYSGSVLKAAHAKIYGCNLYNGNRLVKAFVPVVRNSDSVPGMFDLIGLRFYQNAGTGSFVAGDPVIEDYTIINSAYLKVNGQWNPLIGSDVNDVGN